MASSITILSTLLLLLFTITPSQSTSIQEILPQFGLPPGIIPDSVTNYTFNPEDGELQVELREQPCYVQLDDYLLSYDKRVSGFLKLGSITKLTGLRMKRYLFWVDVDEIKVDLPPHNLIYFQVGFVNRKLDVQLFQSLHSCSSSKRLFNKLLHQFNVMPQLIMD
ncbi:hypothetical protein KSS87_023593 [Heliosperma pusillum]|nr:hypothetical protein KSS87_023593 [Heliosperma pusillum]